MTWVNAIIDPQQLRPKPQLPSTTTGKVGGVAFYSTQDADREGQKGRFFVWTPDAIREVLTPALPGGGPESA